MRLAKFIGAASVAALLTFHSTATPAETTDLVTVTVVGSGANEAEARLDAIRQATQQVASQVVVAERRIVDDEVVYDNVMSTMNGFVHDFTELDVTKSGTEVQIKAEVVVSGSLMRDFASGQASSVAVDGGGMFGELLRSKSQAEVHQKMFESIWRRHTDGIEAKISLREYDEDYVTFDLALKWKEDFRRSIESFFSKVSYSSCVGINLPYDSYYYFLRDINQTLYDKIAAGSCDLKSTSIEKAQKELNTNSDLNWSMDYNSLGFHTACFVSGPREISSQSQEISVNCYLTEPFTILPLISDKIRVIDDFSPRGRTNIGSENIALISDDGRELPYGIDPLSVNVDVIFLNAKNLEIKTANLKIPENLLFGVYAGGADFGGGQAHFWSYVFRIRDAAIQVKIPTKSIPLQEVHAISVAVIRPEN